MEPSVMPLMSCWGKTSMPERPPELGDRRDPAMNERLPGVRRSGNGRPATGASIVEPAAGEIGAHDQPTRIDTRRRGCLAAASRPAASVADLTFLPGLPRVILKERQIQSHTSPACGRRSMSTMKSEDAIGAKGRPFT